MGRMGWATWCSLEFFHSRDAFAYWICINNACTNPFPTFIILTYNKGPTYPESIYFTLIWLFKYVLQLHLWRREGCGWCKNNRLLEKMWASMGKGKKVLHLNCHTYFNYLILFYCENISLLPFLKFLFLLFYDEKDRNKSCKFHKFLLLILCNA